MRMSMGRAFNARMFSTMQRLETTAGAYDANNDWVPGAEVATSFQGVIRAMKQELVPTDGGVRFNDFKILYVQTDKVTLNIVDKISFKNVRYNILEELDNGMFEYRGFVLEKASSSD